MNLGVQPLQSPSKSRTQQRRWGDSGEPSVQTCQQALLCGSTASVILHKGHRRWPDPGRPKSEARFRKRMLSLSYKNRLKSHKQ